MKFLSVAVLGFCVVNSINAFAVDSPPRATVALPVNSGASSASPTSKAAHRAGPVIGGMLEDGREVPERYRDKKVSSNNSSQKSDDEKNGSTEK